MNVGQAAYLLGQKATGGYQCMFRSVCQAKDRFPAVLNTCMVPHYLFSRREATLHKQSIDAGEGGLWLGNIIDGLVEGMAMFFKNGVAYGTDTSGREFPSVLKIEAFVNFSP